MSTSFKGYLPTNTFVMAKRARAAAAPSVEELEDVVNASMAAPAASVTPAQNPAPARAVNASAISQDIVFIEASSTLEGASTELLNKMIDAMGVKRDKALITHFANVDVAALAGKVVVTLGEEAAQKILAATQPLSALRAKVHFLKGGPKVIATYHPTFLMQTPAAKKDAWEDLKLAMRELSVK